VKTPFYCSLILTGLCSLPAAAQTYYADTVDGPLTDRPTRILQTNSAGTDVFVFDPETMEQVGYIPNLPHNHGATVHADGTHYYFTNEHEQTVDVVNTQTFEVEERIQLANGPHNLSASMRARKVYVAIIAEPLIQVIDMDSHEIVANIETGGGVHNTFVTPDGRYAVGGMIGASEIIAIDTETDEVAWEMSIPYTQKPFTGGVRPIAFHHQPRWLYPFTAHQCWWLARFLGSRLGLPGSNQQDQPAGRRLESNRSNRGWHSECT
jgi:hypothetical protein